MRHRQERYLSLIGPDADAAAVTDVGLAEPLGEVTKPDELTWWDWTVFLLHTAAEIEHALMVQYLYAAYSLPTVPREGEAPFHFQGPNVPPNAQGIVRSWRSKIVGIAKEEMGHLITVQNLLRFIGAALNFEREDFPFRTLYPFHFQLEPLTKDSLAKYVAAEMPEHPHRSDELMGEIAERATGSAGGLDVNRVGLLYAELGTIFRDSTKLSDNDLFPETAESFQAKEKEWHGGGPIIVRPLRSRHDAEEALDEIGEQGEGPGQPADDTTSHFGRFIQIYKGNPQANPPIPPYPETNDWIPFRPVPTNPNTLIPAPSSDDHLEDSRITHRVSRLWAQLSNVRYRMLLLSIAHALCLEGEPMRGNLRDWAFLEMHGESFEGGLKGISEKLVQLPLKAEGSPQERAAALPFELPYTLALPDREPDRWRLHLALITSARGLIEEIEKALDPDDLPDAVLEELKEIDLQKQRVIDPKTQP